MKIVLKLAFCSFLLSALIQGGGTPAARADDSLADAFAFPVPYRPSDGPDIVFTNLPDAVSIRIFTLNGDIVRNLSSDASGGQLEWNVANEDGDPVLSGVYLYLIESGGQTKRGKLLVIR
jgi:hypothetical protein